jgi:AraC-like DNA-binding protein
LWDGSLASVKMAFVYRELRPPPGLSHLACGWIGDGAEARVLPDGCVDVVLSAGRVVVAGPATTAVDVAPTPGQHRCGVRFRVGAAGAALGVPANVLRDLSLPLEELWGAEGRRLSEAVAKAADGGGALAVLAHGLAQPRAPLDLYARQAALLATGRPFTEISRELGFSERQLRRRVEHAVGYGPRTLARVVRLQRFLRAAECAPGASLARLAADAGFADQAHLARDCRRLTGCSPSMLLSAGATAAGERTSGSFKPAMSGSATLSR